MRIYWRFDRLIKISAGPRINSISIEFFSPIDRFSYGFLEFVSRIIFNLSEQPTFPRSGGNRNFYSARKLKIRIQLPAPSDNPSA